MEGRSTKRLLRWTAASGPTGSPAEQGVTNVIHDAAGDCDPRRFLVQSKHRSQRHAVVPGRIRVRPRAAALTRADAGECDMERERERAREAEKHLMELRKALH